MFYLLLASEVLRRLDNDTRPAGVGTIENVLLATDGRDRLHQKPLTADVWLFAGEGVAERREERGQGGEFSL